MGSDFSGKNGKNKGEVLFFLYFIYGFVLHFAIIPVLFSSYP
jgi:hypothetical protein